MTRSPEHDDSETTNTIESDAATAEATPADNGTPVLELTDVVIHYGRIRALHGISLHVNAGELVTLLGANGAGKSTTMRGVSGLNKLSAGDIRFHGESITKWSPHERVARGIVQVPEGRRIFPGMTVLENLDMGCYGRKFPNKAAYKEALDHVFDVFPRLGERRKQYGGTMSGGEQQMLAIGRALMARPTLLLLDEPSMGLAPMVIQQIFRIIAQINADGTTVLLVEQNAQQALSRSDRGYIMETGTITKEGPGKALLVDDAVREAYLGVA
ncbi:ABC transporter ATP-binding protein [Gordonia sp. ABSL49_1]|uniref:ABC transporter ATP-binding protein n=1 Tax=Gordonia sp. ABSL49_1 TaxID=2920941 RepID=UPI001F0E0FE8|nr:ABC transporter ATP-binding protein [Gordonia sp. ABSL49_1]MCH5641419.1 ABC transporter ATP-binding protein [Gordonia sp. ABSL49_1]